MASPVLTLSQLDLYPRAALARFGRFAGGIVTADTIDPQTKLHVEANLRLFDAGALVESGFAGGKGTALVGRRGLIPPPRSLTPDRDPAVYRFNARLEKTSCVQVAKLARPALAALRCASAAALYACLSADDRPVPASLSITVSPSNATAQGFTTSDGYAIRFSRVLVGIGDTSLPVCAPKAKTLEPMPPRPTRNIDLRSAQAQTANIRMEAEALFRDDAVSAAPNFRFTPFAAADSNADCVLTLAELRAVSVSALTDAGPFETQLTSVDDGGGGNRSGMILRVNHVLEFSTTRRVAGLAKLPQGDEAEHQQLAKHARSLLNSI